MSTVALIIAQLEKARRELTNGVFLLEQAERRSNAATPGGLTGYDSAVLSGIRRKANRKADDRRWGAYSKEAALVVQVTDLRGKVARLERALVSARQEQDRVPFTRDDLKDAVVVRDQFGWHKVARVNQKSVSVDTGYSWVDRIPFDRVLEYREATK